MSLLFAAALALTEADLLRGISFVESSHRVNAPDGDLDKPICRRSVGQFQVTPRAVRELVRVGRLKPMRGFSMTNCTAIRKWLAVPRQNKVAAREYLRLMLARNKGDVGASLCAYNGGKKGCDYAAKVLRAAEGK